MNIPRPDMPKLLGSPMRRLSFTRKRRSKQSPKRGRTSSANVRDAEAQTQQTPQTPQTPVSSRRSTTTPASHRSSPTSLDSFDSLYQFDIGRKDVSPSSARDASGRTLRQYRNVVLDFCQLSVTLFPSLSAGGSSLSRARQVEEQMQQFKTLLRQESIHYRRIPDTHPLYATTIRLRDPADMHRLVCMLPPALQSYTPI